MFVLLLNRYAERELRKSAQSLGVHSGPESFFKVNREQRGVNTTEGIGKDSDSSESEESSDFHSDSSDFLH